MTGEKSSFPGHESEVAKEARLTPQTPIETDKFMRDFLDKSPLIKLLKEKGVIKEMRYGDRPQPLEGKNKVGMLDHPQSWEQGIMDAATHIRDLYVKAQELSGGRLRKDPDWKTLASAVASGDVPLENERKGQSWHSDVGLKYYQRLERDRQRVQSRNKIDRA
jgi:hypothetical protein